MVTQTEIASRIDAFMENKVDILKKDCLNAKEFHNRCLILHYDFQAEKFGEVDLPIHAFFQNQEMKDILWHNVLPKLFKLHSDHLKQILCVCIASESWMWEPPDGWDIKQKVPDNFREIFTKRDAFTINFETLTFAINHSWEFVPGPARKIDHYKTIDSRVPGNKLYGNIPELFKRYNQIAQN